MKFYHADGRALEVKERTKRQIWKVLKSYCGQEALQNLEYIGNQRISVNNGNIYEVNRRYFMHDSEYNIDDHRIEGNVITVTLDDGRKGIAKCSPDDKSNLAFGTALAVARAYGDKETEAKLLEEPSEPVKEEPKFKVGEKV